jgi:endonuclease YncB( thermonuclease family)
MSNNFKDYNIDNTDFFSLKGLNTEARVVNVVDGDTLVLIIFLFDKYFKFYSRISGIDTCEVRSNNKEIKEFGLAAKYRIIELLCPNKKISEIMCITKKQIIDLFKENICIVKIECFEFDKYGRLLANIFTTKNINLAKTLLEEKLAYQYDGKTKLNEEEQLNLLLNIIS